MEQTRGEVRDVLGDLYQGGITYGEAGQFLTPEDIARLMTKLQTAGLPAHPDRMPVVCDPCCGSGRMLLAVAEEHPGWELVGQDVDLRCVRMTAINLALRNLYGYVIHGDSLAGERKLVYRTGLNGRDFVREIAVNACPSPVQDAAATPRQPPPNPGAPSHQLDLFP